MLIPPATFRYAPHPGDVTGVSRKKRRRKRLSVTFKGFPELYVWIGCQMSDAGSVSTTSCVDGTSGASNYLPWVSTNPTLHHSLIYIHSLIYTHILFERIYAHQHLIYSVLFTY